MKILFEFLEILKIRRLLNLLEHLFALLLLQFLHFQVLRVLQHVVLNGQVHVDLGLPGTQRPLLKSLVVARVQRHLLLNYSLVILNVVALVLLDVTVNSIFLHLVGRVTARIPPQFLLF